ncbi:SAM-dependent methyltransferase [Streptomyces sp. NBC_01381]|uniref:N-6 DNA methylase n=1 Tax=Streptomyces sp. NBC_01381 TaxID=2903845 RepID=UPI002255BBB3|nr:N-6 DNA methylase [Streptomyces sp. NBC_01381]MCX4666412.1 SAM-dependent methyltransferase [Streptomyces sp. NBC_01381]
MTQLDLFAALEEEPKPIPAAFTAPKAPPAPSRPTLTAAATPARPHRVKPSGDPHGHAMRVGEAVAGVWHRQHGGPHIEVPIGIVAALSLIRQKDGSGPDLKAQILAQDRTQLIAMYREIWSTHWMHRPDLIDRARILHEWLNDEEIDDHRAYLVRAVTKAALAQGLFDLTGHSDPYLRAQTDVLSPVMTLVRSSGAQQGLGEYHTPAPIADALAAGTIVGIPFAVKEPRAGEHIHDPAAGSGGLLRSAAQYLREHDFDPAQFQWSMVDIDEIAAACAAVNSIIWNLGPRVTVACADSIANPNAVEEAMEHARAVFAHRDEMLGKARIIAALRQTEHLLEQASAIAA